MQPPPGFPSQFPPRGFRGGPSFPPHRGYHGNSFPPRGYHASPFPPRGNARNQESSFPHLRSVPPPPMGGVLRPARFEPPVGPPQPLFKPHNGFGNGFPGPGAQRGRGRGREQGFRGRHQARGSRQSMSVPRPAVQTTVKPMCDTCDKAFPNEAELAQHIAQHVTCELEGCKFSAHAKIVAKHVEMQHHTGLYSRLVMGLKPEEVARWREERRRSFPTRANVEKKMQATRERQDRGERMFEPRGRFNRRGKWNQRPLQPAAQQHVKCSTDMSATNTTLQNPKSNSESTIANQNTSNGNAEEVKPLLPSALANLADSYCTSSDSEAAPEEIATVRCREDFSEDMSVQKISSVTRPSVQQRHIEKLRKQPSLRQRYSVQRRPPTLLQKLLEGEIRHERNLILQCVRHVVQNDFFK